jgi:succinyl-diaminopimelate desuccinylase
MQTIAAEVAERFNVEIEVIEHLKFEAPEPTPPDCPVVIKLAQAIQEVIGVQARPVGIGGQTVAAFFRKRGLHAAAWQKAIDCAHAPNERISIEDLALNAKVFARMMI